MSNIKKGAVLLPQSQLTDDELEAITGGVLPTMSIEPAPLPLPLKRPRFDIPRFDGPTTSLYAGCSADTGDSGAMGCPG